MQGINEGGGPDIVKDTIKKLILKKIKGFLKVVLANLFIIILMIALVIAAATEIFNIFSNVFSGFTGDKYDINVEDVREWADGLSDAEIDEIIELGSSIHPKKIADYLNLEVNSYPKNVRIKVPVETSVNGGSPTVSYESYNYRLGDTSHPYRLWWQSTAVLDVVNESSLYEDKKDFINIVAEDLLPMYLWADSHINYVEDDIYGKTSELEEITTEVVSYYTVSESSEGSSSTSDTTTTTTITYKPLPFLKSVDTMFSNYSFNYERQSVYSGPTTTVDSNSYSVTYEDIVDGESVEREVWYTDTTYTTYENTVDTWAISSTAHEHHDSFGEFLNDNNLDRVDDPHFMFYVAAELPQNNDFINEYGSYLDYIEGNGGSIEFEGDFGDYSGKGMVWPVPGNTRISSSYGYRIHPVLNTRKFHSGIDIPATSGTSVIAVEDGIVTISGNQGSYGLAIKINHGGGIETFYAHNSILIAKVGQEVKKGDVIARVGSTGRSTGPHLHFEVRKNDRHVNPLPWIR